MISAIAELGYQPEIVRSPIKLSSTAVRSTSEIPQVVANAIQEARASGRSVFVDFYAEWCGACKTMDRTTFKDSEVIKALDNFVFLKVDTDEYPEAAKFFAVVGMPTFIVLDTSGTEVYRQVGPIDAEELTDQLLGLL